MFDIFAKLLSSIASFLFPLFASYKALKTSDPAQLTPWLMYWVVLACALLVESWTEWFLCWIPFYAYIRLLFLLYLVLPQTQGARIIYQTYVHPWLEDNETAIEDFIASSHERLRAAGIAYLKRAIEALKTNVFGLPPSPEAASASAPTGPQTSQSYTQSLLARFSLPAARWPANSGAGAGAGDFYSFLASAVSAATSATAAYGDTTRGAGSANAGSASIVPESIRGAAARLSYITAQRERLNLVLSALDREATQLQGEGLSARSLSGQSGASGLTKSRSEGDFEKLDAESGAEEMDDGASIRRRGGTPSAAATTPGGGSWMPWGWGTAGDSNTPTGDSARSSGVDK
ncbi:hypothetical protein OQA88_6991 [Cercophora sp. LCS_1]